MALCHACMRRLIFCGTRSRSLLGKGDQQSDRLAILMGPKSSFADTDMTYGCFTDVLHSEGQLNHSMLLKLFQENKFILVLDAQRCICQTELSGMPISTSALIATASLK